MSQFGRCDVRNWTAVVWPLTDLLLFGLLASLLIGVGLPLASDMDESTVLIFLFAVVLFGPIAAIIVVVRMVIATSAAQRRPTYLARSALTLVWATMAGVVALLPSLSWPDTQSRVLYVSLLGLTALVVPLTPPAPRWPSR